MPAIKPAPDRSTRKENMADLDGSVLDRLFATIASRRGADPGVSYTAKLFSEGRGRIAQKLGEEAIETVIAALSKDTSSGGAGLAGESADLLYHLLVLWADAGIAPAEVWAALEGRVGISGIAEKAARDNKG
jgi:phosphoribosyl-ATP pyrophosphohydrolase